MVFRKTSADTDGAYLEVEATYAEMSDRRPPIHLHPNQDELFQVQEGELAFLVEGKEQTVSAGGELALPKGNLHTVWNPGPAPCTFRWRTTPALKTEYMYELLWNLAEDGKMGRHGKPRPSLLQAEDLHIALPQRRRRPDGLRGATMLRGPQEEHCDEAQPVRRTEERPAHRGHRADGRREVQVAAGRPADR